MRDELVGLLAETKYDLVMWNYQVTYNESIQLLQNLARMGVDLRVILERAVYGGNTREYRSFVSKTEPVGIRVQSDDHLGVNFQHAKTILIDDQRAIISTANMSYPSFWRNREYRYVTSEPSIITSLQDLFAADRSGHTIDPATIDDHLLICPIDCRSKLRRLFDQVEESVTIQAQYLEDPELISILQEQQDERDIRVVVGAHQDREAVVGLSDMVRVLKSPYVHAKNILIDDRYLLVGSMNLSTNAIDNNREISIISTDTEVIDDFQRQFEYDWEEAVSLLSE
jgi:phosphatidylserine/phosphatidylglycerophosphate/cardiolipin synthase-like enzyme